MASATESLVDLLARADRGFPGRRARRSGPGEHPSPVVGRDSDCRAPITSRACPWPTRSRRRSTPAPTRTTQPPRSTTARDVVALLLLRDLIDATQHPTLSEVRAAIEDIFTTRATETRTVGAAPRTWPTRGTAHAHWGPSFARAADSAGLTIAPAVPSTGSTHRVWLPIGGCGRC
jgi:hypothetical protein